MSTLASQGNRVLFVENTGVRSPTLKDIPRLKSRLKNWWRSSKGIRKEQDNLYIYSPLVLPFPYSRMACRINQWILLRTIRRWVASMGFARPIIWTFLPTRVALDIANGIPHEALVYYCIDNFAASSPKAKRVVKTEQEVIRQADLVFVTSRDLQSYCEQFRPVALFFPFAVKSETFVPVREGNSEQPPDLAAIPRPRIGYVGGLHQWGDWELVRHAAERFPDYHFVLVGPEQTSVGCLEGLSNVHRLGARPHGDLPYYIDGFDVCLIPYRLTHYTDHVYPTKLNEYLIMGKPVVATNLKEIKAYRDEYGEVVAIAHDEEEFCRLIEESLKEEPDQRAQRIAAGEANTWEVRIDQMCSLIEETIAEKKRLTASRWKELWEAVHRMGRRRLVKGLLAGASLYVLLLYTPLTWWVAAPLKINQPPRRVEAIVVFGGGVGETGNPGKSTIERARYAAQLYRDGFAPMVLFSSGYVYRTNDAENMKLVAVSLGVPKEAILLEQRSGNTYENVLYSSEPLRARGIADILLVSSPYHMRRAQLTFLKQAPELKVTYTPVPYSQFYDRHGGNRWRQIRAIAHEYGGILYYWWKGWI
ncbi:MAG: ElyC/SanA/YdcF family protein [bacterium]|nr:ElyC/SanA/YdcF family protein [bacterium]